MLGQEAGAPQRALPPADLEVRYRMLVFLLHLCRDAAELQVETARDRGDVDVDSSDKLKIIVENVPAYTATVHASSQHRDLWNRP